MGNITLRGRRPGRSAGASSVGYISGSDTHTGFVAASDPTKVFGTTDILQFRSEDMKFRRFHVHPNYLRGALRHDFEGVTTLVNLVTDADLHPRVLAASRTMLKGFKGGFSIRPARSCAIRGIRSPRCFRTSRD